MSKCIWCYKDLGIMGMKMHKAVCLEYLYAKAKDALKTAFQNNQLERDTYKQEKRGLMKHFEKLFQPEIFKKFKESHNKGPIIDLTIDQLEKQPEQQQSEYCDQLLQQPGYGNAEDSYLNHLPKETEHESEIILFKHQNEVSKNNYYIAEQKQLEINFLNENQSSKLTLEQKLKLIAKKFNESNESKLQVQDDSLNNQQIESNLKGTLDNKNINKYSESDNEDQENMKSQISTIQKCAPLLKLRDSSFFLQNEKLGNDEIRFEKLTYNNIMEKGNQIGNKQDLDQKQNSKDNQCDNDQLKSNRELNDDQEKLDMEKYKNSNETIVREDYNGVIKTQSDLKIEASVQCDLKVKTKTNKNNSQKKKNKQNLQITENDQLKRKKSLSQIQADQSLSESLSHSDIKIKKEVENEQEKIQKKKQFIIEICKNNDNQKEENQKYLIKSQINQSMNLQPTNNLIFTEKELQYIFYMRAKNQLKQVIKSQKSQDKRKFNYDDEIQLLSKEEFINCQTKSSISNVDNQNENKKSNKKGKKEFLEVWPCKFCKKEYKLFPCLKTHMKKIHNSVAVQKIN